MHSLTILFCYRDKEISRVKNALDSLALQDNLSFNVLFLDYGSSDSFRKHIEGLCSGYKFCSYLYVDSQGKFWNRAEALNYGILNCNSQWIFTADVDLVFKRNFVSYLYQEISADEAKFFSVGYLSDLQTKNLDVKALDALSFTKSEDFALGMVVASKDMFLKVNGYNSFYAIWGMEDNDIKARLDDMGIKTRFIRDVLMLHQYHLLAGTREGGMPQGWIAFSKDYFTGTGEVSGLDKLEFPPARPAKEYRTDKEFVTKTIHGRNLFIRHQLLRYILDLHEKKLILVIDTISHLPPRDPRSTLKFIRFINKVFKVLGIQAHADSQFKEQYVSQREIRDEVYFMVKSLNSKLVDYCIEESEQYIKLAIVKS